MSTTAPKSSARKTPKLRFPGFSGDWEEKSLGNFLLPQLRVVDKPTGPYKAIGIRSHFKGTFQKPDSDPANIAMEELYVVHENDFIVNITFAWEGALAIAKKEDDGGFVSHRFPTYIFNEELTNSKYFSYVFPTNNMKYKLDLISPGGAGRNRVLNKKDLLKIKIHLPSLPEQKKISDVLGFTKQWIEILRSQKETLESYKKGLMQKIFAQEIRFKCDDGKEFPKWEEKKLEELGDIVGGGTPDTKNQAFWRGSIPWISSSDLEEGSIEKIHMHRFITEEAIQNSATHKIPAKSILIVSRVGVGKIAISNIEVCTSQDFQSVIPFKNTMDSTFLAYNLSLKIKDLLQYNQGTSIKGFAKKELQNLYFLVPSQPEQQKIADFLTSIDALIESKQRQISLTGKWKKGLMQELFV